jgi:putative endonuclease
MEKTATPPNRSRQAMGAWGERVAERHLVDALGWRLVDKNWRCRHGEIDLIAEDSGVLVFVEVKTRRSDRFGVPAAAVGAEKLARLRRLVGVYKEDHAWPGGRVRIDVVAITVGPPMRVDHFKGLG